MSKDQVQEAWETIESELESFRFYWDMGDHVMYRAVADHILEAARMLSDIVNDIEDDDDA